MGKRIGRMQFGHQHSQEGESGQFGHQHSPKGESAQPGHQHCEGTNPTKHCEGAIRRNSASGTREGTNRGKPSLAIDTRKAAKRGNARRRDGKAAWNHVPTKAFPTRRSVYEAIRDELGEAER